MGERLHHLPAVDRSHPLLVGKPLEEDRQQGRLLFCLRERYLDPQVQVKELNSAENFWHTAQRG